VSALRWGGVALATVGAGTALISYSQFDTKSTTQPQFRTLSAVNAIGWAAFGLGVGAFALSFPLAPLKPRHAPASVVRVGPGSFQYEVTF
jgi:hypothetical protein